MAVSGNKGEWSEIYALFKLLGDMEVFTGDENLNKKKDRKSTRLNSSHRL